MRNKNFNRLAYAIACTILSVIIFSFIGLFISFSLVEFFFSPYYVIPAGGIFYVISPKLEKYIKMN